MDGPWAFGLAAFSNRVRSLSIGLLVFGCSVCPLIAQTPPPIPAEAKTGETPVDLTLLRKGAREILDGYAQFDVAGAKSGEVVHIEQQKTALCKDLPSVSDAARRQALSAKFEQVGIGRRFPRHTLLFARERPVEVSGKMVNVLDGLAIYFDVSRASGDCLYTFGVDARLLVSGESSADLAGAALTTLLASETSTLKTAIDAVIANLLKWASLEPLQLPESGFVSAEAVQYLDRAATSDAVLIALGNALEKIIAAHVQGISALSKGVSLRFVRYAESPPLIVKTRFLTRTCVAVPSDLGRPTIICNESFLHELELVARSFGVGGILGDRDATTDAGLFKAAARMLQASAYIRTLREEQKFATEGVSQATDDRLLSLALFIVGHELGHLAAYHSAQEFDQTPDKLTAARAIVNLCRQADHFRAHFFKLAGLDPIADRSSEIRSWAEAIRKTVEGADHADAGFLAESRADAYGTGVFLEFLAGTYRKSESEGKRLQSAAVGAVADYALLEWYRRLKSFVAPKCGDVSDMNQVSTCLAFDPTSYVDAFRMYGELHSAVIARAMLFLSAVIAERTTFYDIPLKQRIVFAPDELVRGRPPAKIKEIVAVTHQIFYHLLMREFMDAPGKIAYLGCASGYRYQTGGGPRIFKMQFYPIEAEIARLLRRVFGG